MQPRPRLPHPNAPSQACPRFRKRSPDARLIAQRFITAFPALIALPAGALFYRLFVIKPFAQYLIFQQPPHTLQMTLILEWINYPPVIPVHAFQ